MLQLKFFAHKGNYMLIEPHSTVGIIVLAIFVISLILIILEVQLEMDKFKPALLMMSSVAVIGGYYWFSGAGDAGLLALKKMQAETKEGLFALIAFMAFMWMIVEILNERNVFGALNEFLMDKGLGARGLFWAMGLLSALLSPFISSITTAMIFGKSLQNISADNRYTQVALCNIIVASNSGVWFVGTSTSLMVILSGNLQMPDLLMLIPAGLGGWLLSAWVLDTFYLKRLKGVLVHPLTTRAGMKQGGIALSCISAFAVIGAVVLNLVFKVDIEFALGIGLGLVVFYIWILKRQAIEISLDVQLQKVEWSTLLYYIGIITGMAALNHVGWLSYLARLFEYFSPIAVNVIVGLMSSFIDNNMLEAAALMSKPHLTVDQWTLNTLMVGIGGSLTVVGSAAGVMAMSIDKSYTFAVHLRFLPAVLVNFLGSLAIWYVQFQVFHH
jgi:Na+/H+ antiporter NhaD/arsenite permease-like protein